jgi:hypothetical protein
MKRELFDFEIRHVKRHKTHRVDAPRPPRTSSPSALPSPQTSALTETALSLLQRSLSADDKREEMAALPTLRSTSSHSRGRTRRSVQSYRARTPSPSKRPTPQSYRRRNLSIANVFIDAMPNLPSAIDPVVRHILKIDSWDEQPVALEERLQTIAASYQTRSQRCTRNVSLEGDWNSNLFVLLSQLSDPFATELHAQMSQKGNLLCIIFGGFTLLCLL